MLRSYLDFISPCGGGETLHVLRCVPPSRQLRHSLLLSHHFLHRKYSKVESECRRGIACLVPLNNGWSPSRSFSRHMSSPSWPCRPYDGVYKAQPTDKQFLRPVSSRGLWLLNKAEIISILRSWNLVVFMCDIICSCCRAVTEFGGSRLLFNLTILKTLLV